MQERRRQAGRLWPGHWSARGPAGLVWYVVGLSKTVLPYLFNFAASKHRIWHQNGFLQHTKSERAWMLHFQMCIFAFACRVRWNARLPFPRSATKGGLWETCGHLGMWWVTRSLPIEFFVSISIFSLSRSLSRRPAHIQTHQLSDVESSSPAGVVKRLLPSAAFTVVFHIHFL